MPIADVCLITEGSYPYVAGGVSTWTHDLLLSQPQLKFHIVALSPPTGHFEPKYQLPPNVVSLTDLRLQILPDGVDYLPHRQSEELFKALELPLLNLHHRASLKGLHTIIEALKQPKEPLGRRVLLNSKDAWNMLVRMYLQTMSESSFLNYFWSWRGTLAAFYSVLLAELPSARLYHALCTGYAGLFLARAHMETGQPCMITEHGIYTNERRIEVTSADWLDDARGVNLNIQKPRYDRDLKDYWIDSFVGYSKLAYQCCAKIITLYEGNQELQLLDGADANKLMVIPNGIDYAKYASVGRAQHDRPTIALIGRVVPIKDVKTYLNACALLKNKIPQLSALVMGPTDEDPGYYQECVALASRLGLDGVVTFTGKVKLMDHLSTIDVAVLTSISEAQPLVILEAGAAGIPTVATDVGACREMLLGRSNEMPPLGPGGAVVSLSDPEEVSNALYRLLSDRSYYEQCSKAIQQRVERYYQLNEQVETYRGVYEDLLCLGTALNNT